MSEEKVYTFSEYVLGYDSGGDNDRSCLTISKILNDNMYVMSILHDGSAEAISTILDSLQQKVEQLESIRKEAIDYVYKHIQEYDVDGTFTNLDEFDFIARPQVLLNILNKGDNNE